MLVEYLQVNKINPGVMTYLQLILESNIVNPLRGLRYIALFFLQ